MMEQFFQNPLSVLALCILAYKLGLYINKKTQLAILNPLFIAITAVIAVLQLGGISLDTFNRGGNLINMMLCPATIMLAIPIYKQRSLIRRNLLPIFIGTFTGSVVSMGSIYLLCRWAGISDDIAMSLLPKSTTTPIAIEISNILGGIPALTVAAVIFTGIFGNIFLPFFMRLFRINDSIAAGLAIGTASHAMGTARAVELGETEAALSGIAVGIAGIISVFLALCL